ncbi:MAG TPA: protein phosphatase 2C domain-containing protein, partial [Gemmataceae bacterium]
MTAEVPPAPAAAPAPPRSAGRFRLRDRRDARGPVERWTAEDEAGAATIVLTEPLPAADSEHWPGVAWEEAVRRRAGDLGLPRAVDRFDDDGRACLVLESPPGVPLWDVWDDPALGAAERYGWLARLADLLRTLHRAGAVVEGLRPEQVRITPLGEVVLDPSVVFLPLPPPRDGPVRPSLVSSPELLDGRPIDARADLYCFGTVLLALELGHELSDLEFRGPGDPYPFLDRFPDAHPLIGRLLGKTLARSPENRFPTAPGGDPTGFDELVRALVEAQRVLGRVRLDMAAWSSTGMVRPGNEDALAVVHAAELHEGVQEEYALVLAADGLGGSAAGEVAAALAIQALRRFLLTEPPLRGLTDEPGLPRLAADRGAVRRRLVTALKEANRLVYLAAREDEGRRGMGCTAEAVFLDGRQVVVGHVGDSRTYLLHRGRLVQLTRDLTLVSGLVELGGLTPEQAAAHPRRG